LPPTPVPSTPAPPASVPAPLPATPIPAASPSSPPTTVSPGAAAGIAIGGCACLFVVATLILNWRRNQSRGQPRVATEAPLMSERTIQADKLMEDV
jgi:hypothetical protein